MRRMVAIAAALLATPVAAQARDYCSTRPSLGQSACVLDPGRAAAEAALVDWERDDDTDTVLFADTLLRFGLTDRVEAQVNWTPVGVERDRSTGGRTSRTGDVQVGARIALRNPDGSGLSYGLQPSITIPVGRAPIGEGGWGAGIVAPVSYDLTDTLNLQFSPQLEWTPRDGATGHVVVPTATFGLGVAVDDACELTAESQFSHDDTGDHSRLALAVAWQVSSDFIVDAGGVAGLDHASPALRIYSGISRRF